MTHKCEYCDKQITPCSTPCPNRVDSTHVCCTCDKNTESCELPARVVCEAAGCQLKFKVDWYKIKLDEANQDIAKLKALNNQFRIANIGSIAAQRLVEDGTLDITGIKIFVSKQRMTWDQIDVETGYILMCLHQQFAEQWSGFLNEKAVKVQIRKELIKNTEKKLNDAINAKAGTHNQDGSLKPPKTIKVTLTPFEKLVLHNCTKLGMKQEDSEKLVKSMGMEGEARNLKELGLL